MPPILCAQKVPRRVAAILTNLLSRSTGTPERCIGRIPVWGVPPPLMRLGVSPIRPWKTVMHSAEVLQLDVC